MNITPIEFINLLSTGKTEKDCNRKESDYIDQVELRKLISPKYGHTKY